MLGLQFTEKIYMEREYGIEFYLIIYVGRKMFILWILCLSVTYSTIYEPQHEISNNVVCATRKAQIRLIRAFASHLNIL